MKEFLEKLYYYQASQDSEENIKQNIERSCLLEMFIRVNDFLAGFELKQEREGNRNMGEIEFEV